MIYIFVLNCLQINECFAIYCMRQIFIVLILGCTYTRLYLYSVVLILGSAIIDINNNILHKFMKFNIYFLVTIAGVAIPYLNLSRMLVKIFNASPTTSFNIV